MPQLSVASIRSFQCGSVMSVEQPWSGTPVAKESQHPLRGWMKGTLRIAPGVDLTEPADPEWGQRIENEFATVSGNVLGNRMKSAPMTLAAFKRSLSRRTPPAGFTTALAGLWWAAKDNWDKAHAIVMDESGRDCAWVHAYLHRVEGDPGNARYWYKQAGKPAAIGAIKSEWESIASELIEKLTGR
jgi:hypothetical protein